MRPIGFGCMRLSTDPDRDEASGVATIRAAVEAGATWLDTADAYARDDADRHHNERLIARALGELGSRSSGVTVVTKVGLTRPGGRWVPDGRGTHLRAAAEESRLALGVPALDVVLLHAIDPRTPLATSVRALAQLRDDGVAHKIGLSNVSLVQLREAEAITRIDVVENELSPWNDEALRGGVVAYCEARGIVLLAHTPLGGPKRAGRLEKDAAFAEVAARHGCSAQEVALAWLCELATVIVPIPGARTPERAEAVVRAQQRVLDARDRERLADKRPQLAVRPPDDADGDVVLVIGIPGAGKSDHARALVADGYERLNRDDAGGTLRELLPELDAQLRAGRRRVVLDNTYTTRAARNEVIEVAWRHGVPVRCMWIDTPIEIAHANAARRMIAANEGVLPSPEVIKRRQRKEPVFLGPNVLHRVKRELEPPTSDEGFRAIDVVPFTPRARPGFTRAAVFITLEALEHESAASTLAAHPHDPASLYAFARSDDDSSRDVLDARLVAACARLGLSERPPLAVCPHPDGPPVCWCRPPLPGLLVEAIERDRIDPTRSIVITTKPAHRAWARAIGARIVLMET